MTMSLHTITHFSWRLLTAVMLCIGLVATASGGERVNLFEAERIIAQSAGEDRQVEVLAEALDEVLRRSSGRSVLPDHPALDDARESPQNLLRSFNLADSDETIPDAIGNPQPTYLLEMEFEGALIRDLLASADIPVWTSLRPSTLLLLAGPDGEQINLLSADMDVSAVTTATDEGFATGLPLVWPLLDLEDQLAISANDIWGGVHEAMVSVSERYQADAVLGGYVGMQPDSGQWIGRWHLVFAGERTSSTFFGEDLDTVIRQGMQMASRALSSRYTIDFARGNTHQHELNILNLTNLETHGAVRNYLNDLIGTEAVAMRSLEGDEGRYRLTTRADRDTLLDLLALEGGLQEAPTIGGGAGRFGSEPELEFVWRN